MSWKSAIQIKCIIIIIIISEHAVNKRLRFQSNSNEAALCVISTFIIFGLALGMHARIVARTISANRLWAQSYPESFHRVFTERKVATYRVSGELAY